MLPALTHVCVPSVSFRVTCGLWESPLLRWQKVPPVSTFLWVSSVAGRLSAGTEPSLPGAILAFLLLCRAQCGFELACLESKVIVAQPKIHSFQSCVRILCLKGKRKERERNFGNLVCLTGSACRLFLNCSLPNAKLEPTHSL